MVVQWEDRFYESVRGHTILCDPENIGGPDNQDAIYPRLLANPANNILRSDFWLFNAKYLRVKFIQAGYRFNSTYLNKYGIKNARLYVNTQNPFLFTKLKMADPESQGGSWTYGMMRIFSVGLTANF